MNRLRIHARQSLLWVLGSLLLAALSSGPAAAAPSCTAGNGLIDETLSSGARWQMCWEERTREGIVLSEIYYSPPGGAERKIMEQLTLSQIHVPYDDNGARFHDITDYGAGGGNLQGLTADDCPGSQFLVDGTKNAACKRILPRGSSFDIDGLQNQGEMLAIFSVSPIGAYNYIPTYHFEDDGAIEVRIGATGNLQRFDYNVGSKAPTAEAWPLDSAGNRHGIAHIHNYYFRMDFDLAGTANNDIVEQVDVVPDATASTRATTITPFLTEAAADVAPSLLRTWRIREAAGGATNTHGHLVGYELVPLETGHRDEGPSFEPFTHDDFYVTRYSACEQFASHNNQLLGCGDHLQDFVSGESVQGEDVVVWYGMTFHHIPRDEDEAHMHAHWNGFRLEPRDWNDATPSIPVEIECPPDAINFETFALEPYSNQDQGGTAVAADDGATLRMTGNTWKRSVGTYDIQTGTQLIFDFASQEEGELHTIGFDVNQTLNDAPANFLLYGTQNWSGGSRIDVTPDYSGGGAYQSFAITVSDHFTGDDLHLVFGNDKDSGAATNDGRFQCVRVVQPNAAPVWADPGAQTHAEGESVNLALSATDPNGNPVSYSLTSLPGGLTLDATTGLITGVVDYTAAALSPYSITLTADDGTETTDQVITWTVTNVNRAPIWVDPGTQVSAEGDAINLALMAPDPDLDSVTFTAPGLPAGLTLNETTGLISGSIDYLASLNSPYSITATATDGDLSVPQLITWQVANTNRAPVWTAPGNPAHAEGDVVSVSLVATDPDGDPVTYSAAPLPSGLTLADASGLITGTIDYTANANSPYTVSLSATDGSAFAAASMSWSVGNTNRLPMWTDPGPQSNQEGATVSMQLVVADPDGEDVLSFTAVDLPPSLDLDTQTGLIDGVVSYDAADQGPDYMVVVTVDDGTTSVDQSFTWSIQQSAAPGVPLASPIVLGGLASLLCGLGGLLASRQREPTDKASSLGGA